MALLVALLAGLSGGARRIAGVEGHASISAEVLSRYAADAALGVEGVRGLVERALPYRRGVKLEAEDGRVKVELRLAVEWNASILRVGREVQRAVCEYLREMAAVDVADVHVVVDEIGPNRAV